MNKVLIVDFSNIAYQAIYNAMSEVKIHTKDLTPELIKHWQFKMTERLVGLLRKHKPNEVLICCDSGISWRKKFFPHYKAKRASHKEKYHKYDMKQFHEQLDIFTGILKEHFPVKVFQSKFAEGDDIIAILTRYLKKDNEIIIASIDKDMKQLLDGSRVKMWNLRNKDWEYCDDTERYLIYHILKGDTSDGIPNIFNPDDAFVREVYEHTKVFIKWAKKNGGEGVPVLTEFEYIDFMEENYPETLRSLENEYSETTGKAPKPLKRQIACGDKKIDEIFDYGVKKFIKENNLMENYKRNRKLVRLDRGSIPDKLIDHIEAMYERTPTVPFNELKLLQYLRKKGFRFSPRDVRVFNLPKTTKSLQGLF